MKQKLSELGSFRILCNFYSSSCSSHHHVHQNNIKGSKNTESWNISKNSLNRPAKFKVEVKEIRKSLKNDEHPPVVFITLTLIATVFNPSTSKGWTHLHRFPPVAVCAKRREQQTWQLTAPSRKQQQQLSKYMWLGSQSHPDQRTWLYLKPNIL